MRNIRKKIALLVCALFVLAVPITAHASSFNCIITDPDGVVTYQYIPNAADEAATPDNPIAGRSLTITGSDVWLTVWYTGNDTLWHPTYGSEGYVSSPQSHYVRAEVWEGTSSGLLVGPENYGVGEIWSRTTTNGFPATNATNPRARVFYRG